MKTKKIKKIGGKQKVCDSGNETKKTSENLKL